MIELVVVVLITAILFFPEHVGRTVGRAYRAFRNTW